MRHQQHDHEPDNHALLDTAPTLSPLESTQPTTAPSLVNGDVVEDGNSMMTTSIGPARTKLTEGRNVRILLLQRIDRGGLFRHQQARHTHLYSILSSL